MANTVATTALNSDAAGLDAHAATLTGAGNMVANVNTMLERVEAQMRQAGMGAEVTKELATLRDLGAAYKSQAIKARAVLEQVNRQVQEAYDASRGQAADKGYQMGGR
ncbi:hypothetical protein ABZ635_22670 [Nocardiopsis sp. NPDC007018]|uniref:hypothetical protein n=1 Tax=Nocardiopsis sp. NPDC007018 TaxID=3155721 RepID=UPI00340CD7FF